MANKGTKFGFKTLIPGNRPPFGSGAELVQEKLANIGFSSIGDKEEGFFLRFLFRGMCHCRPPPPLL